MSRDPQNPHEEIARYGNDIPRDEGDQGLYPGQEGEPPDDLGDAEDTGQRVIGELKERREQEGSR